MTFSMAVFPGAMTARQPAFPAVAAISLLGAHGYGRRFTVGMLHWVVQIGT